MNHVAASGFPFTMLWLVMAGGALGAGLRFLIAHFSLLQFGARFPIGTLSVNLLGAFAAGYALVWLEGRDGGAWLRAFLVTGLLGGMTTFSALMVETLVLQREPRGELALGYLAVSMFGGLLAVWAGARLATL